MTRTSQVSSVGTLVVPVGTGEIGEKSNTISGWDMTNTITNTFRTCSGMGCEKTLAHLILVALYCLLELSFRHVVEYILVIHIQSCC